MEDPKTEPYISEICVQSFVLKQFLQHGLEVSGSKAFRSISLARSPMDSRLAV